MELSLTNKHILITGASGGIGFETALRFLRAGSNVSLHYNSNRRSIDQLSEQNPEFSLRIFASQANCQNEESVIAAVQSSINHFGPIHVLVANHGIFPPVDVEVKDMSLSQFKNTLDVNLTGVFLYSREFLRQLDHAVREGKIKPEDNPNVVFVGSTSGIFGEVGHCDYSASKSALTYGMCRTIKNEIAKIIPTGRSNVVAPGWVLTAMAKAAIENDPGVLDRATRTIAMRKVAKPEEVADAILFLSSSAASHTSGSIFEVTGGMEGRLLYP